MFWSHGMPTEFYQRRGLVGNLAGLLGDPVEFAELAGRIQEVITIGWPQRMINLFKGRRASPPAWIGALQVRADERAKTFSCAT
jgi:hypothetical protein